MLLLQYVDDWLVVAKSLPRLLYHHDSAPVMPGPEHCYKLEEVGPTTFHSCPVSWHDHRHLVGEGVPFRCSSILVLRLSGRVSCPSFSSSEDVAATDRPHGLSGTVYSQR